MLIYLRAGQGWSQAMLLVLSEVVMLYWRYNPGLKKVGVPCLEAATLTVS